MVFKLSGGKCPNPQVFPVCILIDIRIQAKNRIARRCQIDDAILVTKNMIGIVSVKITLVKVCDYPLIIQQEYIAVIGYPPDPSDVFRRQGNNHMMLQPRIVDPTLKRPGLFIIDGHTVGGSHIDPALPVFRNGFLVSGSNFFFFSNQPVFIAIQALVRGTNPQALPGILKQAAHPDDRLVVFILHLLKGLTIIPHQPRIAADPQIAVMTLGNGICLIGQHAVPAVKQRLLIRRKQRPVMLCLRHYRKQAQR